MLSSSAMSVTATDPVPDKASNSTVPSTSISPVTVAFPPTARFPASSRSSIS